MECTTGIYHFKKKKNTATDDVVPSCVCVLCVNGHGMGGEVRGELCGVRSLLFLRRFWGLNSGCQAYKANSAVAHCDIFFFFFKVMCVGVLPAWASVYHLWA